MVTCTNCGQGSEGKFCQRCGYKLPQKYDTDNPHLNAEPHRLTGACETKAKCPTCGATIFLSSYLATVTSINRRFCGSCGHPFVYVPSV